jgi:phospholipid/cholesterol/gamma-HCH transport system ATP-binding protein
MDTRPDQTLISIRDLVVGFGSQIVLDHLDLDVRQGEILGIVGASGSGKSVLLRTMIGLLPKREGSIVAGPHFREAASTCDRNSGAQRWGILFQQGALFSALTVRQKRSVSAAGKPETFPPTA